MKSKTRHSLVEKMEKELRSVLQVTATEAGLRLGSILALCDVFLRFLFGRHGAVSLTRIRGGSL